MVVITITDQNTSILDSAFLAHSQIQPSTTEWQPDLMMDTYIHHTLQRSLQPSQLASLPRPAGHYDEGGVYGQRYGR